MRIKLPLIDIDMFMGVRFAVQNLAPDENTYTAIEHVMTYARWLNVGKPKTVTIEIADFQEITPKDVIGNG